MALDQHTAEPPGASRDAIGSHYDVGVGFFEQWLDPTLTYSSALWEAGDTLETAQLRKLDYAASEAGAVGARRVLDVGCGWGSMLTRLVEEHGVEAAVGLTLSETQRDRIAGWDDPRREVRLEHWHEHEPDAPYDAIVSIGALEHFVRHGTSRADKVRTYREFLSRCRRWLAPGGRLYVQAICKGNARLTAKALADARFVFEEVFPQSDVPWPAELVQATEWLFDLVRLRNDADHYVQTLDAWRERLLARREEGEREVGAGAVEHYDRYLRTAREHFAEGHAGLLRVTLAAV